MNIFLGTDHAGFELKETIKEFLAGRGYAVKDCGNVLYDKTDDYPDFIKPVAVAVANDPEQSRGIIFGWSGQGEAIVANRFPGVRAVVYVGQGEEAIMLSREHNDANVLSFGAHFVKPSDAKRLVQVWLSTPFSGEARHLRRIQKIDHQ